jgi:hypothetical protein
VTYAAYIDFVSERDDLDFYTVDTDYGCGVIKKRGPSGRLGNTIARPWFRAFGGADAERRDLLAAWRGTANDGDARFDFVPAAPDGAAQPDFGRCLPRPRPQVKRTLWPKLV